MFTFHAKPLSPSQQIFVEVICERLTREILVKSYREAQLFYTRTIGDNDTSAYNIANRTTFSFGLSPLFRNAKMIWRSWNVDLTNLCSDNVGQTHAMADESARCIINAIVQRLDHFQTHSASIPSGQAKEIRSRFGSGNL